MPVPSNITDLSTTAGSNSPAGTDPIGTDADNYIRAHAAFIAQLRDGSKNLELGTATAPSLAFTGDSNTGVYSPAADQVALSAGGAKRFFVGSSGASIPSGLVLSLNNSLDNAAANIVNSGSTGASVLDFKTASTTRLSISDGGIITNPSNTQPSFLATGSGATSAGSNVELGTYSEAYDYGSNFNPTTGRFTAPVAGLYTFTFCIYGNGLASSGYYAQLYKNGGTVSGAPVVYPEHVDSDIYAMNTVQIVLAANDYVSVFANSGSVSKTLTCTSFFGRLLG